MAEARPIRTPILRELPGVFQSQPVASGTNLALLPLYTYGKLLVLLTIAGVAATRAQIIAQLTQLRVVLSGKEIWIGSGTQLANISGYYAENDSQTTVPGFLDLDFLSGWMNDNEGRLGSVLGTQDQASLQLEFTWAAGATINASSMYAARFATSENTGITRRFMRVSPNVGAVGLFTYPDLPLPRTGDTLLAIHLFPPVVANLTRVAYVVDDVRFVDAIPDALNRIYLEAHPPRTPQGAGGMVTIDLCALTGMSGSGMPMESIGNHVLELTFANAAPGSFQALCEFASPIAAGR